MSDKQETTSAASIATEDTTTIAAAVATEKKTHDVDYADVDGAKEDQVSDQSL